MRNVLGLLKTCPFLYFCWWLDVNEKYISVKQTVWPVIGSSWALCGGKHEVLKIERQHSIEAAPPDRGETSVMSLWWVSYHSLQFQPCPNQRKILRWPGDNWRKCESGAKNLAKVFARSAYVIKVPKTSQVHYRSTATSRSLLSHNL